MSFQPSQYTPGDPWTTPDFFTRALTGPRLSVDATAVDDQTPDSWWEYRKQVANERFVEASIKLMAGPATGFSVDLERSMDAGANWSVVDRFTDSVAEETIRVNNACMMRLRVTAIAGQTLRLEMRQDL